MEFKCDFVIKQNVKTIQDLVLKHFEIKDFIEVYEEIEVLKCKFFVEERNKVCNKKIKNKENSRDYCEIHSQLNEMYENYDSRNKGINNFSLTHIKDDLYRDIFDNVFKINIETKEGLFYGVFKNKKIIKY